VRAQGAAEIKRMEADVMTKTEDGDMAEWGEWVQVAGEGLDDFVEIL